MDVSDLIAALDAKTAESEATIRDLQAWLATEQQALTDLRREAAAVRSALDRVNGGRAQTSPGDSSWLNLSQVNAVERALREGGPMHLRDISALLVAKGRDGTTTAAVSACLTQLRQVRGSVVNVGKGRWDYAHPAPSLRVVGADEKLPGQEVRTPIGPAFPVSDTGRPID